MFAVERWTIFWYNSLSISVERKGKTMPNKQWGKLNNLQLGRYGELYAQMEFLSYGMDVYPSEVDDHGVDLIVKSKSGKYYEIQVKGMYKTKYVFVKNEYIDDSTREYLVCLMVFVDEQEPKMYLIPSDAWKDTSSKLFVDRSYEYGINVSNKNEQQLDKYIFDKMIDCL